MNAASATRTQWVLDRLEPFARAQGMTYLPAQKQFRAVTPTGFLALIVSLSHYAADSVLELHLGLRNDLIERTAFRYTDGLAAFAPDSFTLITSTAGLRGRRYDRFTVATEADAERAVADLLPWLEAHAAFFWQSYDSVSAVDRALNEAPEAPTPLMPNQQLRCLRGLTAARYAQRPDWTELVPLYRRRLEELYAPENLLYGYTRLVDFLQTYTPN